MSTNPYFGAERPCFVIAEIGANHNGDLDLCLKSMEAAARTGVDAIKLQYYTAAELVADVDRVWAWGPKGAQTEERVGDMFDRLALNIDEMRQAYEYGAKLGLPVFSTPFSVRGVANLEGIGNPLWKVASSDLAYYPLLDAIAATGKPVIVSTGKSPLEDVHEALEHLSPLAPADVAVLHCIAQYPAPYDQMNIRVISSFQKLFPEHAVGLSDHCTTQEPALAAVALGAKVIEKHFTLGHDLEGPDHWFSMNPEQMTQLVQQTRRVEAALGDGAKGIAACEEWEAEYSRRSIIVMREVAAGQVLQAEDLAMLRPGTGLHPRHWDDVVGLRVPKDIAARQPLTWEMVGRR